MKVLVFQNDEKKVCVLKGGMILTGETEVLGEKQYTGWVVDGWMIMERWWNDTDRGN